MVDPRTERLASLLVDYCTQIQEGDKVYVASNIEGLPLVREVYRNLLRVGALPFARLDDEGLTELLLKEGSEAQLRHVAEPRRILVEQYDAQIGIFAPTNTRYLSGIDPSRSAILRQANQPLQETVMRRTAAQEFRWVGTQFPTRAAAQDADMSLSDYADFVYGACHLDSEDPVAVWRNIKERQQGYVDWLSGKQQVVVKGENIDLSLSIEGRSFINDDGRFNMPGGEIFTGPVEDSVNGWVRFSYPAVYGGNEVIGAELYFENGRVVKATAAKGEAFLLSVLDTDEGARYLGEWAIGTNYGIDRFTRNILFDEKIGGTLHMALGAGYPETGSVNRSAVHWDMICDLRDGAEITVDGERIYAEGKFLIA